MHLGNYVEDTTNAGGLFTSRNTTGEASALSSGLVDVYKLSSTTPTTAGVTLTSTFASVTGLNRVQIDLSSTTFYAASEEYYVVLSQGEVNGVDVTGEVVFGFSIENRWPSTSNLKDAASTAIEDHGASTHTTTDVFDQSKNAASTYGLDMLVASTVVPADVADDSIIARMVSKSTAADWDSFDNTADSLEAIRDRGDTAWVTGGGGSLTTTDVFDQSKNALSTYGVSTHTAADTMNPDVLVHDATIQTVTSQTQFTIDKGSTITDDVYNNQIAIITDAGSSANRAIVTILESSGWGSTTQTVHLSTDPPFTISTDDRIDIMAVTGSSLGIYISTDGYVQIEGTLNQLDDLNNLGTTDILDQAKNAQSTHGLDMLVNSSAVPADIADDSIIARMVSASTVADWDSFDNTADSLEAIRDRGDTAWVTGGGGSLTTTDVFDQAKNANSTQGVSTHTTTDILDQSKNAISTAGVSTHTTTDILDQSKNALSTHGVSTHTASEVHTAAMTESYTTGNNPTLAQLLFQMQAFHQNFTINSSAYTAFQVGSTTSTAATWELDDSTSPSGIRRTG